MCSTPAPLARISALHVNFSERVFTVLICFSKMLMSKKFYYSGRRLKQNQR